MVYNLGKFLNFSYIFFSKFFFGGISILNLVCFFRVLYIIFVGGNVQCGISHLFYPYLFF